MSETAAAPAGGKNKTIVIVVVALVLAAAGYFFFLKPSDGAEKAPEPGAVLAIDPVTVNLAGGNYLKVGVALQMSADAGGHGEPNGAHAADLLIEEFSGRSLSEVTSKRAELKASLEKKIVKAYHGDVLSIYLVDYVAQ